jgi:hypothetical protein
VLTANRHLPERLIFVPRPIFSVKTLIFLLVIGQKKDIQKML